MSGYGVRVIVGVREMASGVSVGESVNIGDCSKGVEGETWLVEKKETVGSDDKVGDKAVLAMVVNVGALVAVGLGVCSVVRVPQA